MVIKNAFKFREKIYYIDFKLKQQQQQKTKQSYKDVKKNLKGTIKWQNLGGGSV